MSANPVITGSPYSESPRARWLRSIRGWYRTRQRSFWATSSWWSTQACVHTLPGCYGRHWKIPFQRPVKFVCVTHYHADHTFGLRTFTDVTLFASAKIIDTLAQSPDWSPEARARWKRDDPDGGEWLDEVEFAQPQLLFHRRLDIVSGDDLVEFHHSGGT